MSSTFIAVSCILLLFTNNISAEIFHHRDVRQVGYGYNNGYDNNRNNNGYNNGYSNGYDNNRYNDAYASNGYNNGYGNTGYDTRYGSSNQFDQQQMVTTTQQSYLKNGLKGAAIGALASSAYTWWRNGK